MPPLSRSLTLKQVRSYILERDEEWKLLALLEGFLGPAVLLTACSALAVGCPAAFAGSLALLGTGQSLISSGRQVLRKLTKVADTNPGEKLDCLTAAHALLPLFAFYASLEKVMPVVCGKLRTRSESKAKTPWYESLDCSKTPSFNLTSLEFDEIDKRGVSTIWTSRLAAPHPSETLNETKASLGEVVNSLLQAATNAVLQSDLWSAADTSRQDEARKILESLPEEFDRQYLAWYLELARSHPELLAWAHLDSHTSTRALLDDIQGHWKDFFKYARSEFSGQREGFAELSQLFQALPQSLRDAEAGRLRDSLTGRYVIQANSKLISDQGAIGGTAVGGESLNFPTRLEAYIPPAFKSIRVKGRESLADEATWSKTEMRANLGAFLYSFLSSPYSSESPLLVIGDPGSGKSMLTRVLAAQLSGRAFTPIRVELRARSEVPLLQQIDEQIAHDTLAKDGSFERLSPLFADCPPVILIDGLDELLQASGKVHSEYLIQIAEFQQHCKESGKGRVSVIVTSRIALIGKTVVPPSSTVVRLEPFTDEQRDRWIQIWNRTNETYFHIRPLERAHFSIPLGHPDIEVLSRQPLLLLMLAIFDSEKCELSRSQNLNRTNLFNQLILRFVEREKTRGESFLNDTPPEARSESFEEELHILGIVAVGMFNRRSVVVSSDQLGGELEFFGYSADCGRVGSSGRPLSLSEQVFGRFLFIDESRAEKVTGSSEKSGEACFQFLHNTFGEFLCARFIVEVFLERADFIRINEKSRRSARSAIFPAETAEFLGIEGIASLGFSRLTSRPVIVEMAREWLENRLSSSANLSRSEFVRYFDEICNAELSRICKGREVSKLFLAAQHKWLPECGLLAHLSVFSQNLVVLRVAFSQGEVCISKLRSPSDAIVDETWRALTKLWQVDSSESELLEFASMIDAREGLTGRELRFRKSPSVLVSPGSLEALHQIHATLGNESEAIATGFVLRKRECLESALRPVGGGSHGRSELATWPAHSNAMALRELAAVVSEGPVETDHEAGGQASGEMLLGCLRQILPSLSADTSDSLVVSMVEQVARTTRFSGWRTLRLEDYMTLPQVTAILSKADVRSVGPEQPPSGDTETSLRHYPAVAMTAAGNSWSLVRSLIRSGEFDRATGLLLDLSGGFALGPGECGIKGAMDREVAIAATLAMKWYSSERKAVDTWYAEIAPHLQVILGRGTLNCLPYGVVMSVCEAIDNWPDKSARSRWTECTIRELVRIYSNNAKDEGKDKRRVQPHLTDSILFDACERHLDPKSTASGVTTAAMSEFVFARASYVRALITNDLHGMNQVQLRAHAASGIQFLHLVSYFNRPIDIDPLPMIRLFSSTLPTLTGKSHARAWHWCARFMSMCLDFMSTDKTIKDDSFRALLADLGVPSKVIRAAEYNVVQTKKALELLRAKRQSPGFRNEDS